MNGCVYAHIGDDGAVLCDRYSDFGRGIISYCDDICLDKHPSNADKIRAMTDDEMAARFANLTDCVCCPCRDKYDQCDTVDGSCQLQWLSWLKQEASA